MISQFPALQVVIPLIGAPLCIILRRGALPWLVALLVSWVALAMAATLLQQKQEVVETDDVVETVEVVEK